MKKKYLLAGLLTLTIIIVLLIVLLNTDVEKEADYSGEWYSADDHGLYIFRDGLVYNEKHEILLDDGSYISGAYVFAGNKIALFVKGVKGLEAVQELYLIENDEESILCSNKKGNGEIFFIRESLK